MEDENSSVKNLAERDLRKKNTKNKTRCNSRYALVNWLKEPRGAALRGLTHLHTKGREQYLSVCYQRTALSSSNPCCLILEYKSSFLSPPMLLCTSFVKSMQLYLGSRLFLFGEQQQMCLLRGHCFWQFIYADETIHSFGESWTQWLPLCTSWKIYSISGSWIYIPQAFGHNGIVSGPPRAGIWLRESVDGFLWHGPVHFYMLALGTVL